MKGRRIDLKGLLGRDIPCECGGTHHVATEEVIAGEGAIRGIVPILKRFAGHGAISLVADENTWFAAGWECARLIKGAGYALKNSVIVPKRGGKVKCDDCTIGSLESSVPEGTDFMVSVGSGTVSDLGKAVATRKGIDFGTVATAPSMNGYTSTIFAVLEKGVKKTVPSNAARFVICDIDILINAPSDMVSAGVGDLLSKPVSGADWLLASMIEGSYHCPFPARVADRALRGVLNRGVPKRFTRPFVRDLSNSLLLSGISMAIAGTSAPASGGEHLLSHFWDMAGEVDGREVNLHGLQVGFATLVSLSLYERLMKLRPTDFTIERAKRNAPDMERVKGVFSRLPQATYIEILPVLEKKVGSCRNPSPFIRGLKERWEGIRGELSRLLLPLEKIEDIHRRAGVPVRARELALTAKDLEEAIIFSLYIRDRFTLYDLLLRTGFLMEWGEEMVERFK